LEKVAGGWRFSPESPEAITGHPRTASHLTFRNPGRVGKSSQSLEVFAGVPGGDNRIHPDWANREVKIASMRMWFNV
jgi:hypothetical protein